MDIEDIKSPLPPRRANIQEEPEIPIEIPPEENINVGEKVSENEATNEPGFTSVSSKPIEKKGFDFKSLDKKQLIIFGGIGLAIVLIFILIFGVLVPNLRRNSGKKTVINYWGLWEDSSVINGIIADYEAKNPNIQIKYTQQQRNDYRTRLAGRLTKTGQSGEEVPDIFRIHSTWIPMFRNILAPVPTTTANNLKLDNDFFDTYKRDLKEGNSYLAIPLMYDGLALFYNKDLIDAAQVELPKSWWNLENAANKLTVRDNSGNIKIAGAAMGLVDNIDHWSDILGLMAKQNGVNFLINDPTNNKKLQDVIAFYTLFATKDKVWNSSLPSSTEMFAAGKLAFYFAPSWRIFNIEEMNPNLKFEITTVPQLPTLANVPIDQITNDTDLTDIHWSTYWVEGVNSKSKNQKEAWKFLEYLASNENLEKMFTTESQIRSFGEIYPKKSLAESLASNPKINPFTSKADKAENWYLASRTFDDGLNDEMIKYFGDAVNSVVKNGKDPSDVMTPLRNGVNQLIQKYQLKR